MAATVPVEGNDGGADHVGGLGDHDPAPAIDLAFLGARVDVEPGC